MIHGAFIPNRVIAGSDGSAAGSQIPLLENRGMKDGKTTVYICENFTCQRPITDLDELRTEIERLSPRS